MGENNTANFWSSLDSLGASVLSGAGKIVDGIAQGLGTELAAPPDKQTTTVAGNAQPTSQPTNTGFTIPVGNITIVVLGGLAIWGLIKLAK